MNYTELYEKWGNRPVYDNQSSGKINVHRDSDYKLAHMEGYKIIADVWVLPTIFGWAFDEKKRKEFYKDAKEAKLSRNIYTKNEWYKIIDII